ncbi:hypothetical protein D3C78_976820 [compost metagenome]
MTSSCSLSFRLPNRVNGVSKLSAALAKCEKKMSLLCTRRRKAFLATLNRAIFPAIGLLSTAIARFITDWPSQLWLQWVSLRAHSSIEFTHSGFDTMMLPGQGGKPKLIRVSLNSRMVSISPGHSRPLRTSSALS